jgi:flagellar motor switch protein FliN/FliY
VRNLTEDQIKKMLNLVGDQEIQNNQIKKARFSLLQYTPVEDAKEDISILNEIPLELEVELGSTLLNLREVINLHEGEVITLDRIAGDTVDLRANKQWLAYGEVLVLNEVLGIRVSSFNKDGDFSGRGVK